MSSIKYLIIFSLIFFNVQAFSVTLESPSKLVTITPNEDEQSIELSVCIKGDDSPCSVQKVDINTINQKIEKAKVVLKKLLEPASVEEIRADLNLQLATGERAWRELPMGGEITASDPVMVDFVLDVTLPNMPSLLDELQADFPEQLEFFISKIKELDGYTNKMSDVDMEKALAKLKKQLALD